MHTVHDRFMRDDNFARLAHGSVVDVESRLRPLVVGTHKVAAQHLHKGQATQ
jgi:hypothetical protein